MKKGKHVENSSSGVWSIVLLVVMSSVFVAAIIAIIMSVRINSTNEQTVFKESSGQNDFFDSYDSNEAMENIDADLVFGQVENSHVVFNGNSVKTLTFTNSTSDVFKYKTQQNYIALTFDDCPLGEMDTLFDLLDEYDMRCTFFMLGEYMKYDEGWAKEAVKRGHTVANHSYSHPNFSRLNERGIKNQLDKTEKLIEQETGIKPVMIRPPYGSYNDGVKKILNDSGYTIAMWNVDSEDWKDIDNAYERAAQAKKGDVVLFHTLHATKGDLRGLLENYKSRGLKSIPMEELIILEKLENEDIESLKELGLKLK